MFGRHGVVVLGSEEGQEEVEELTLDACKQTIEVEVDHRGLNLSAELAGVGEGKRPDLLNHDTNRRFLLQGR